MAETTGMIDNTKGPDGPIEVSGLLTLAKLLEAKFILEQAAIDYEPKAWDMFGNEDPEDWWKK